MFGKVSNMKSRGERKLFLGGDVFDAETDEGVIVPVILGDFSLLLQAVITQKTELRPQ